MKDQKRQQVQQSWRDAAMLCFGALLVCVSGVAQAASLGKIEVASPLGKPLYAEVPLKLKSNELASKVFIEIAAPADYKIFEVYRDPVLNSIRADVASDERGARVKLTSRIAMQSPFFNLVLKVRYGRVSHFKKYAVFLDAAKPIQRVADETPVPHVVVIPSVATHEREPASARVESAGKVLAREQDMLQAQQPTVYQGWARTEKYGPIVRGDSLSVVAQRLRVDQRYSTSQIMVALFEKNKTSFNQNNLNLIKANSFLQVPSAEEVEKHSKSEAYRISLEHRKAWKNEPRYAVEAEVQRKRYSPRVSVGERAEGQIDSPADTQKSVQNDVNNAIASPVIQDLLKPEKMLEPEKTKPAANAEPVAVEVAKASLAPAAVSQEFESMMQAQTETNQLLLALQQKNEQLQQQLIANKSSVDALNAKVDEGATAASNARVAKLELLLTRLQAELEKQADQPATAKPESLDWVTWLLLSLLIVMLGVIAMLMRKEPVHPSSTEQALAFDREAEHPAVAASEPNVDHLEEAVEKEIDAIETDDQEVSLAKETGTFDAMAAFTDELSDTDTAELEPFDVDAKQELDPSVDYVSEADVYIRYGMDEEALQQLDMALRLNAEHAEAHLKKAEVLHGRQDKQAFSAALAAATLALGATALDQYKASVEAFGGDVDAAPEPSVPSELPMVDGIDTIAPVTMAIDDAEIDALDFDLAGLNVKLEEQADNADAMPDQGSDLAISDDLDWLSDPSFDSPASASPSDEPVSDGTDDRSDNQVDDQSEIETIAVASGTFDLNAEIETPGLLSTSAATQQLDALLGEFAGAENTSELGIDSGLSNEQKDDLDGLLSEFTEQDDVGDDLSHLIAEDSVADGDNVEAGATQHLDSLLNEFSSDDDLSFPDAKVDFDPLVMEQAKASTELESDDGAGIAVDANYGATQELDSLLAEFSDDDDGLSFLEPADVATPQANEASESDLELDHGATQELNTLLGEFIDDDALQGQDHADPGATQVLGRLLDEFGDDDDEDDTKKS